MRKIVSTMTALALTCVFACRAYGQAPAEVSDAVKAMGRVVNSAATAKIFAPRLAAPEIGSDVLVERDVHYGAADRNLLDVFRSAGPATPAQPVLLFVHGGGFVAGSRRAPGSPFYDNIMLWAVHHGMVGVTMTYRLAPQNTWPAGGEDVGLAVKWVREHIAAYGGDPANIVLLGHSAGAAHVADYLAFPRLQPDKTAGVAGAILLSGAYQVGPPLAIPAYHGNDPEKFAEESSLPGLLASKVPLFVGSAEFDLPPFSAQAALLIDSLCKASRCPDSAVFLGLNHMGEPYSIGTDVHAVSDAVLKFVQAH